MKRALALLLALWLPLAALAADKTFDNDSADGKWSTAANWDADTKPVNGDTVSTFSADCTLDENSATLAGLTVNANKLHLDAGNTLTVQDGAITVSSGAELEFDGGTLQWNETDAAAHACTISGSVTGTANGGTWNLSAATATKLTVVFGANDAKIEGNSASRLNMVGDAGAQPAYYVYPSSYADILIANAVIDALERKYGNIRSTLEVVDVSTPATVIRYTNNWKGSLEGWMLSPKLGLNPQMKKVLPGLNNFYMAGQWVQPGGGLPSGILSGRHVTQIICKEDRKTFVTK